MTPTLAPHRYERLPSPTLLQRSTRGHAPYHIAIGTRTSGWHQSHIGWDRSLCGAIFNPWSVYCGEPVTARTLLFLPDPICKLCGRSADKLLEEKTCGRGRERGRRGQR